jgi:O-antigen chain-terminating methyltransferase
MVEASTLAGFDARLGDGIAHLRSLNDRSLGGVIAIQVVEHLTKSQLEELMRLCASKVEKGGKIVFETINPRSVLALSSNYFRDPTHIWPLHPDTLAYIMSLSGLEIEEVKLLSPVSTSALLKDIPVEEYMTPRWAHAISLINHNFKQLNELLYGYQDYCVIAKAV